MQINDMLCPICGETLTSGINPDWAVCVNRKCKVDSIRVTPDAITLELFDDRSDTIVIPTGIFIPIREQPL